MTIAQDVLKPEVPAYIELFELDFSPTNIAELSGVKMYLTPMVQANYTPVMFGNQQYSPFPLELTGIKQSSEGAPPRPTLAVANINKYFGSLAFVYYDIIGTSVTYIRTFEPYLNLASRLSLPPMKFTIAKKLTHNKLGLSFELRIPTDKERAFMPRRQMLKKDFPGLGINKNVA